MTLKNSRFLVAGMVVLALFLWWGFGWFLPEYFAWKPLPGWERRGQFGDQFGAANALFSGIAMVGAVTALLMQIKEHGNEAAHRRATTAESSRLVELQSATAELEALAALVAAEGHVGTINGAEMATKKVKLELLVKRIEGVLARVAEIRAAKK